MGRFLDGLNEIAREWAARQQVGFDLRAREVEWLRFRTWFNIENANIRRLRLRSCVKKDGSLLTRDYSRLLTNHSERATGGDA